MEEQIKITLKARFVDQLRCDMTNGREANDFEPWNQSEQDQFLEKYDHEINRLVGLMIKAYKDDNELEELVDPENDWICEFLYDDPEQLIDFNDLINPSHSNEE